MFVTSRTSPFEAIRLRSIRVELSLDPSLPKLGGSSIPVMQAADLWDGNDLALGRMFDFSRDWGVSFQGLMWPRVVIIVEVRS
jgi:hypothetical protein